MGSPAIFRRELNVEEPLFKFIKRAPIVRSASEYFEDEEENLGPTTPLRPPDNSRANIVVVNKPELMELRPNLKNLRMNVSSEATPDRSLYVQHAIVTNTIIPIHNNYNYALF